MEFILKYLIFAAITISSIFLPKVFFEKHYRVLIVAYMLVVGIIFIYKP